MNTNMKVKMKAVEWHVQSASNNNKCQVMCVPWTCTSLNFQIIQRRKDRDTECAQVVTMKRETA